MNRVISKDCAEVGDREKVDVFIGKGNADYLDKGWLVEVMYWNGGCWCGFV